MFRQEGRLVYWKCISIGFFPSPAQHWFRPFYGSKVAGRRQVNCQGWSHRRLWAIAVHSAYPRACCYHVRHFRFISITNPPNGRQEDASTLWSEREGLWVWQTQSLSMYNGCDLLHSYVSSYFHLQVDYPKTSLSALHRVGVISKCRSQREILADWCQKSKGSTWSI